MLFLLPNVFPWPSFFYKHLKDKVCLSFSTIFWKKDLLPIPHFYAISVFPFLISNCRYLSYVICIINVFHSVNLVLNTVTSIHSIQKSRYSQNLGNKIETARLFEDKERETKLISKKLEEKEKVLRRRNC